MTAAAAIGDTGRSGVAPLSAPDPEPTVLDEWAMWMGAAGASAKTIRTRVQGIQALARYVGKADPADLTTRDMIKWLARSGLSKWSRQTYWYTVTAFGTWLAAQGLVEQNPAERIPKPAAAKSHARPVEDRVIAHMLEHPTSTRAYAYTVLAVFAGLRAHEIAKMRGDWIIDGWLYVNGKGDEDAAIPAHPRVLQLAKRMPRGYWFPGSEHGHVRPVSITITLGKGLRLAGSSETPHGLRHSYGTKLLRQSRNMRVAQAGLRHQSIGSTQIYTQVAGRELQEAIHRLEYGNGNSGHSV